MPFEITNNNMRKFKTICAYLFYITNKQLVNLVNIVFLKL